MKINKILIKSKIFYFKFTNFGIKFNITQITNFLILTRK